MALPRGLCPQCGRSVALDERKRLWDHNASPNGGGALFRIKRVTGTYPQGANPLCPGSGQFAKTQP